MDIPLLTTKFTLPPATSKLVRRERLLQSIDDGLDSGRLLTLICAPAGYGKTTLANQWVHHHQEQSPASMSPARRFAWLSLDPADNDLARFTSYLVAALQRVEAGIGQGAETALQQPRSMPPQALATLLINDLSALSGQIVLVLDEYHHLQAQAIHDLMSFLVDHQPGLIHLVVLSRADPQLPLARLRARGQLTEIRQQDLALTEAESDEFFNQLMQLDLAPAQLQVLESRTEGWAAGLQLAALSLRHAKDGAAFIQTFSGGQEYIADYLAGEVLERQEDSVRSFLLQTSILTQLCGPLCEAVTGQPGGAATLQQLMAANLFLVPLDYQGEWYRYHALFADLLRKRLHQAGGGSVAELHRRAGRWYAGNKMLDQAVEHFLAGGDYPAAAALIESQVERIFLHGQAATFLRWLDSFPQEQQSAYPVLLVFQGLAMLLLGKISEAALAQLQEVAVAAQEFRGEADTLQALYAVMKGNALQAIELSESALRQLPEGRHFMRILAADSLAMAHALRGDMSSAAGAYQRMVDVAQQAGNTAMMLTGLSSLAGLRFQQGQLHQAAGDYRQVIEICRERLGGLAPALGKALLGMGEIAREWNDLPGAKTYFFEAQEVFAQFIDIGAAIVDLSLARVYISEDNLTQAQAILEAARRHASASQATALDDRLAELMQVRMWITLGELDLAAQWAKRKGLMDQPVQDLVALADHSATAFELIQGEYLAVVRLYLAQENPSRALEILDVLLAHNEKRGQMRRVIEVLVLRAIAYQQQGAEPPARQAFSRALDLAEPEGYVRTFLDEGRPVARLLSQALPAGYAARLLDEFAGQEAQAAAVHKQPAGSAGLLEPLSERELQVLELIAAGLSNQEIASRLYISLSTVKGHISHIYGKLGVNSRTQALARASSLGLVRQ